MLLKSKIKEPPEKAIKTDDMRRNKIKRKTSRFSLSESFFFIGS